MKKLLFLYTFFGFLIFNTSLALAQASNRLKGNNCLYDSSLTGVNNVVTLGCIVPLFANIIYWLMIFAGTVAVFFIIFGGIKLLTSSGDPGRVDAAKKTITWAIVGLIVVLLSFMIVNIIADITGVNCITDFGFSACSSPPPPSGPGPIRL